MSKSSRQHIGVDTTTNVVTTNGNTIPKNYQTQIDFIKSALDGTIDLQQWLDYDIYLLLQKTSDVHSVIEKIREQKDNPNAWMSVQGKKKNKAKQQKSQTGRSNDGYGQRGSESRQRYQRNRDGDQRQATRGNSTRSNGGNRSDGRGDRSDGRGRYNNRDSNNRGQGDRERYGRGNRDAGRDRGRGNRRDGRGYREDYKKEDRRDGRDDRQYDKQDQQSNKPVQSKGLQSKGLQSKGKPNRSVNDRESNNSKDVAGRDSGERKQDDAREGRGPRGAARNTRNTNAPAGAPRNRKGGARQPPQARTPQAAPAARSNNSGAMSYSAKARAGTQQEWRKKEQKKQAPEKPKQRKKEKPQPTQSAPVAKEPTEAQEPLLPPENTQMEPVATNVHTEQADTRQEQVDKTPVLLTPSVILDGYEDAGLSFGSFGAPQKQPQLIMDEQIRVKEEPNQDTELEPSTAQIERAQAAAEAKEMAPQQAQRAKDAELQSQQAPAQQNMHQGQQAPQMENNNMAGGPNQSMPPLQQNVNQQQLRGPPGGFYHQGMPPNFPMRGYRPGPGYEEQARFFAEQTQHPGNAHPGNAHPPNMHPSAPHPSNVNHQNFQEGQNFEHRGQVQDKFNDNTAESQHQEGNQQSSGAPQGMQSAPERMAYGNLHGMQSQYGQNMPYGYPPFMNQYPGYHPAQPGSYPFRGVFPSFHGPKHTPAGYANNFGPPSAHGGLPGSGSPGPAQGMPPGGHVPGGHGPGAPPAGYAQPPYGQPSMGQPGNEEDYSTKGNVAYGVYGHVPPPPGMDAREGQQANPNVQAPNMSQGNKQNPRNGNHMSSSNEVLGQYNADRAQYSDPYSFYGAPRSTVNRRTDGVSQGPPGQAPFPMQPPNVPMQGMQANMMMYGAPSPQHSPHTSNKVYTTNQQASHYASK